MNELQRAADALQSIPPDLPRDEWVKVGMAAQAAGLDFDTWDQWSASGQSYDPRAARDTWRSFKPGRGISAGTLHHMAREYGAPQAPRRPLERPRKPIQGYDPAEVLARCKPLESHAYIDRKAAAGVPLEGLRVVPEGDSLRVAGQSMAGALVVPAYGPDGLQSLQLIPPQGKKVNLPGCPMSGAFFTVGEMVPGGIAYVVEGIGQAWACWQATGRPAVVCFGCGNMGKVAAHLRAGDPDALLVLVPDRGQEAKAQEIAQEVGAAVVYMPEDAPANFDANDLAQAQGHDVLADLLEKAQEPPKPAPRFKLLGADDLRSLPPLAWWVKGVIPATGLAAAFGPSGSGKSFLMFDLAAQMADGGEWFGHRVEAGPVVYCALEGEAGFKLRSQAWEAHRGRSLPRGLHMMLQPFALTNPKDVSDLASVVPAGAAIIIDTLNRAAPTADENASRDMGEIIQAAKRLQELTGGLVLLVHHTGKNAAAGLRGHSSLFAALDAALEVSRDGDRREWRVAKAKDGEDGNAHPFRLKVQPLGEDADGDPVSSCVIVEDRTAEDVARVKLPSGGNQKLVLEALRPLFKDGRTGKPGAPPLRPCIELEAAIAAGSSRLTCPPDRRNTRAREAITGLVARGILGLNEGWLWLI